MSSPAPRVAPGAAQRSASTVIRRIEDIPANKGLMTGDKGKAVLRLPEGQRSAVAVLDMGNSRVCMLINDGQRANGAVFEMREKLKTLNLVASELVVDAGVLRGVYDRETSIAKGADTQEATSPVIQDFDKLIDECIVDDVSDIHIEVRSDKAFVRTRRNGFLIKEREWVRAYAIEIITAVYNAFSDSGSASTSFNWKQQQQASVTRTMRLGPTKIRFQSVPAYPDDSFDVVLRLQLLDANHGFTSLEQLGYERSHLQILELMMSKPVGAIFIAGTTGSGKSTTIKNMLATIARDRDGIKMYTVEDPPEFLMPFATQIPVARGTNENNPFMEAMKACMRADPDVMMVGEIRDLNTAALAVQMVESGHQMLTTVHADSAIGIVKRLQDIGIPTHTLSYPNFLSGLVYQRLVPILCPNCKIAFEPGEDLRRRALLARIKFVLTEKFAAAKIFDRSPGGCQKCNKQGIVGRTACAEMVIPDSRMREMFAGNHYEEVWKYWRERGRSAPPGSMAGKTALEHALVKMQKGDVSPIDLEKEFGMITQDSEDGAWDAAKLLGLTDLEEEVAAV